MLFNSNIFIFAFLPVALAGFYLFGAAGRVAAASWLILCSLLFYMWWNPPFVLILLASVGMNCLFGRAIFASRRHPKRQSAIFWLAVAANLGALFYFKYLYALLAFLQSHGIAVPAMDDVVLPLGISFYTFTQLGYLVDCKQGLVKEQGTIDYFLFVTFFPHLIVGPILHHREIMPQFAMAQTYRCNPDNLSAGLTMFVMGLAKKVLLADHLASSADMGFDDPQNLAFFAAWGAALAYSLQLYFDFSGRVFGYGRRACAHVRYPVSAEFQLTLQGRQHHRLLAALAHEFDALPDRISLQPGFDGRDALARREGLWRVAQSHRQYWRHCESCHGADVLYDDPGGCLARRGISIPHLRIAAWLVSHHQSRVAFAQTRRRETCGAFAAAKSGMRAVDLSGGACCAGLFPRKLCPIRINHAVRDGGPARHRRRHRASRFPHRPRRCWEAWTGSSGRMASSQSGMPDP